MHRLKALFLFYQYWHLHATSRISPPSAPAYRPKKCWAVPPFFLWKVTETPVKTWQKPRQNLTKTASNPDKIVPSPRIHPKISPTIILDILPFTLPRKATHIHANRSRQTANIRTRANQSWRANKNRRKQATTAPSSRKLGARTARVYTEPASQGIYTHVCAQSIDSVWWAYSVFLNCKVKFGDSRPLISSNYPTFCFCPHLTSLVEYPSPFHAALVFGILGYLIPSLQYHLVSALFVLVSLIAFGLVTLWYPRVSYSLVSVSSGISTFGVGIFDRLWTCHSLVPSGIL